MLPQYPLMHFGGLYTPLRSSIHTDLLIPNANIEFSSDQAVETFQHDDPPPDYFTAMMLLPSTCPSADSSGNMNLSGIFSSSSAPNISNCSIEIETFMDNVECETIKGNPTVVVSNNFDPMADAVELHRALNIHRTNENALIDVICRRSNEQRMMILPYYKSSFGEDLVKDVKNRTKGRLRKLLIALLTPTIDFVVKTLYNAWSGVGTDKDIVIFIDIFCSMNNHEIRNIKNSYQRLYGEIRESEQWTETCSHFKRLLTVLYNTNRDERAVSNIDAARLDVVLLLRSGERQRRFGIYENIYNIILCKRNHFQMKLNGLIAILQCTTNRSEYFATRLYESFNVRKTNHAKLIRIIVSRSEVDLSDIKIAFKQRYGTSLKSWIKGKTYGNYKHALLALIGEAEDSVCPEILFLIIFILCLSVLVLFPLFSQK